MKWYTIQIQPGLSVQVQAKSRAAARKSVNVCTMEQLEAEFPVERKREPFFKVGDTVLLNNDYQLPQMSTAEAREISKPAKVLEVGPPIPVSGLPSKYKGILYPLQVDGPMGNLMIDDNSVHKGD